MKTCLLLTLTALLACTSVGAQPLDDSSLNGKYHFAELLIDVWIGEVVDARNLSGSITFNGDGTYTFAGKLGAGSGALAATDGTGTYSVSSSGDVTLSNPLEKTRNLNARLSAGGVIVLGSTTEPDENAYDIFVAIRAPAGSVTNAVLQGEYTGATLLFPNGSSAGMRSALVSLAADGAGGFTTVGITGHANSNAGRNITEEITDATYNLGGNGSGTAAFGNNAALVAGTSDIYVSGDGNYVLGTSRAAGGRDIFLATKNSSGTASEAAFAGRYWIAELTLTRPAWLSPQFSISCASGAVNSLGNGNAMFAERVLLDTKPLDVTALNSYRVNPDSTGILAPRLTAGVTNMGIGARVNLGETPRVGAMVGAQVGPVGETTQRYGILFAVLAPSFAGNGVFLNPAGVVNGGSFAPAPNPVAPGEVTSLFGTNLAPRTGAASALPLPLTLEGVSVTVGGAAVPLFSVSPGQVNIQVPYGLTDSAVAVVVNNGGVLSNEVMVPLAPTSPGILFYTDFANPMRGIIAHADFSLVTPSSPAAPGETVIIYVVGLGEMVPAVLTGEGNPSNPLAVAEDRQIEVLFGGEPATTVWFAGGSPGFAGLSQVNAEIPADVPRGDIPVAILTRNAASDLVDIAIDF